MLRNIAKEQLEGKDEKFCEMPGRGHCTYVAAAVTCTGSAGRKDHSNYYLFFPPSSGQPHACAHTGSFRWTWFINEDGKLEERTIGRLLGGSSRSKMRGGCVSLYTCMIFLQSKNILKIVVGGKSYYGLIS